jgi:hypothetical protein
MVGGDRHGDEVIGEEEKDDQRRRNHESVGQHHADG